MLGMQSSLLDVYHIVYHPARKMQAIALQTEHSKQSSLLSLSAEESIVTFTELDTLVNSMNISILDVITLRTNSCRIGETDRRKTDQPVAY